ncbi:MULTISPECIES: DUF1571 domain-containing protein [unclassified Serratia (in: enterobacteria)]|uniref:DUF1571 domain-containing protein n=1 Tax=unclassified Serratia (in: enterobacteria) TaxID=2647522 RepID=UPI0030761203
MPIPRVCVASTNAATFLPPSNESSADPIILAQQHFEYIESYQVKIISKSALGENNVIRYSYRKPGYVRMDFTEPHPGAVLVYNPTSSTVRLWPFGLHQLPVLNLSPANSLIRDQNGHRVDQSDVGTLLRNIRSLQQGGETTIVGKEILQGQPVLHVSVNGPAGFTVSDVHRSELWLENSHHFPIKVVSYGIDGHVIESVFMDAIVFNIQFPDNFFTP